MPSPEAPPPAFHRGGSGPPLVLLHGINASWRIWRPVLASLERAHDVFAPTLPGHYGGPALVDGAPVSIGALADGLERILDANGIETAHIAGNSLGGWLSIELGRRGRARSITALSPAGGWSSPRDVSRVIRLLSAGRAAIDRGDMIGIEQLVRRPRFRRLAFLGAMERGDRMTAADAVDLLRDAAGCDAYYGFTAWVRDQATLAAADDPQGYPIRIAWAEHDRTIPFARYGQPILTALPDAEHVTLPGVGHVPMFDDPALVVRTILEFTSRVPRHDTGERAVPDSTDITIQGGRGTVVVRRWEGADPKRIVVLAHGIGEHSGRYQHVADALVADGSVVYAPDHHGHGRSDGEPGLVTSIEPMADDLGRVVDLAVSEHPDLPVALIGHSLGGMIVTRYLQRGDDRIDAAVLTGPPIGGNPGFEALLGMDPLPDVPIDPAILSRDPEVGRAYAEDPLVYHGPLSRQSLEAVFAAVAAIGDGPGFGDLPVLWLHGEGDQLAPLQNTREMVETLRGPNTEEKVYPGAQHEILNETNKDEVIGDVTEFLAVRLSPAATT